MSSVAWPSFMRFGSSLRNRIALRLAGRVGSLALLEHAGRRTGMTRTTPVRAFRRGDTVAIGINFGREAAWVRNILAAGGCTMTLRGHRLGLVQPRIVPLEEATSTLPRWFALGLRVVVRTQECLVLAVDRSVSGR